MSCPRSAAGVPAGVSSRGVLGNYITRGEAQGSVAAAAYRRGPTGDFPEGFFWGLLSNPQGHVA